MKGHKRSGKPEVIRNPKDFQTPKMTDVLKIAIPSDVVQCIKLYTGETRIRNGKPMNQIKPSDIRRKMLLKMPKIVQLHAGAYFNETDRGGIAWFKTLDKKKHVAITVLYCPLYKCLVWEMSILGNGSAKKAIL
jgi:hypothetical protein